MPTPEEMREANVRLRGSGSAEEYVSVTPDDAADLPLGAARAIYVGVAGAVVLKDRFGHTVTLISGGEQYHPLWVTRIFATGTTATNILALY